MTITVNAIAFDVKRSNGTSVELQNFAVAPLVAQTMKIAVSDPKPQKDFVGMGKAEGKITFRDAQGAVSGIYTISSSVRADVSDADKTSQLTTIVALAGHASFTNAVKFGKVPFTG